MKIILTISIMYLLITSFIFGQKTPHGDNFNLACSNCHTTESWKVNLDKIKFDHGTTKFKLTGQHKYLKCNSCHKALKFSDLPTDCSDCHTDIHQNSVGFDCENCHNTNSWVVSDILKIHDESRFPLVGAHETVDCYQCHVSVSLLNFKPIGVECYQCHEQQYLAASAPNHIQSGFSRNCEECHYLSADSWGFSSFIHDFFPLRGGHAISDCSACHEQGSYKGVTTDCYTCHRTNYENAVNPNHFANGFGTDCASCHSIDGWVPAVFKEHDALYFEIYSGQHDGEWDSCSDCHVDPNNYSIYSCLKCHDSNNPD